MNPSVLSTYRLQLRPEFGFDDAAAIVPYLSRLGVSHLYLSPVFDAVPGSTHGYDIVDPNGLRSELGGRAAFDRLVTAVDREDMGLVLDIVPHHMAAHAENGWWWSVLELGRDSPYAFHFDIDWDPPERRLRGTLLLPVLGDHYGRVLEAGELRLAHYRDQIVVQYYDHIAPLSPETANELWALAGRRECAIEDVLGDVNADIDWLDALLSQQHHRFARWQTAAYELDYRRFFDIDSLVALRGERAAVFGDTHRLIRELATDGRVDGLRVDHIDGLRDPEGYLTRLRDAAPSTWLIVEKIMRPGEVLPQTWPADGTTGYDFLALAGGVLIERDGLDALTKAYAEFTGDDSSYSQTRTGARRQALREAIASDVERVVELLLRVCDRDRRARDFTRSELRQAVVELCVHAPHYRTYVRQGVEPTDHDRAFVCAMLDAARASRPDLDEGVLGFLRSLLLNEVAGDAEGEFVARFQQLTGPVAAKGEEDTAFYRWVPLLCLNEVGVEPDDAVISVSEFHEHCGAQQRHWPLTMVTTTTHDTKRSEDVRARLAVLAEEPDAWVAAVDRWHARNDRHRDRDLDAPDARDEWFLYQTLVGAHPIALDRAWVVIEKSLRESKRRTSWLRPYDAYEHATRAFVESILSDDEFVRDLGSVVAPLVDAGYTNSLTLTALRLLCPGVPDTYQGTELWDFSLVDPDNRRPVDFDRRAAAVDAIEASTVADLWESASERARGAPKLALLRACLALRRRHPEAFGIDGSYTPLDVSGTDADRVIAFTRRETVCAVVPRLPRRGAPDDAVITLPDGDWTNLLTSESHAGTVSFGKLRAAAPLAVLERM